MSFGEASVRSILFFPTGYICDIHSFISDFLEVSKRFVLRAVAFILGSI